MQGKGKRGRTRHGMRRTRPEYRLEIAFEGEVRRLPARERRGLLAWLRGWRRRPERVFWVMDEAGVWRRL
jgi:hypothetical protein